MTPLSLAAGGALQIFIVQLLAFVIMAVVLVKLVFPALGKTLGQRSQGIADGFDRIEKETAAARKELAEVKQKVSELSQESGRRQKAALAEAEKLRDQSLADALAQAQALQDKARREIQVERDKAVKELREEAEALTLRAAEHLVKATMDDGHQQRMVENYLGRLDGMKPS